MAFSALTGYISAALNYSPQISGPSSGISFPPIGLTNTLASKSTFVLGGNVAGGVNEVAVNILAIASSGSATINLQSLTDVLGVAPVVLVRLKHYLFALLTATQDSVNGTACSSVTVGNASSNANLLNLGGTTPTFSINSGGFQVYSDPGAAGTTVSASLKNVLVTNNDSGNAAAVLYGLAGATT